MRNRNLTKIGLLVFLLFTVQCSLFTAFADDSRWITVEGQAAIENITKEEARRLAIANARRKAVEDVVGVTVSADTLVINWQVSSDIIRAIPYGKVVEQEMLEEDVKSLREKEKAEPSLIYWVKLKAKVVKEKGEPDPYFKIDATLNRAVFKDNDDMQITIKPAKDCYLSIFNMLENEKVITLFPNNFKNANKIKAGEAFTFPDEQDRKRGISLKSHIHGYNIRGQAGEGKKTTKESLYLICLKQPMAFDTQKFEQGIFGSYSGKSAFISELIKEIVEIPLSERAERLLPYEVRGE